MSYREMISAVRANRVDQVETLQRLANLATSKRRKLTPAEQSEFDRAESEVRALDERITELQALQDADDAAAPMQRKYAPAATTETRTENGNPMSAETRSAAFPGYVRITRSEEVYRPNQKRSWFLDIHDVMRTGDSSARERLERNNKLADEHAAKRGEQRAISTTNGAGGEFVPPLWLTEQYVAKARPRRKFVDLVGSEPLPAGTDSINLPKVASGTATAIQSTQNSGIEVQDLVSTSISSSVSTVAGGQVVSVQLIEQSPVNVDDVIWGDLSADYAMQLDALCLSGDGTGGKPTGVLNLAGTNSVTWSGTALTGTNSLYSAIWSAISKIFTSRYEAPTAIVMHPRRFAWMAAQQDTLGRPVIVPVGGNAVEAENPVGTFGNLAAEGPVGMIAGVPVILDANMPTNLGTGTDQDRIIVVKSDDLRLWESHIRLEAFPQTYANQLSVFVRLYNYVSFQPARYPSSISVISGTGLNQVL
jgi:HK97 family phage major capsid protein